MNNRNILSSHSITGVSFTIDEWYKKNIISKWYTDNMGRTFQFESRQDFEIYCENFHYSNWDYVTDKLTDTKEESIRNYIDSAEIASRDYIINMNERIDRKKRELFELSYLTCKGNDGNK